MSNTLELRGLSVAYDGPPVVSDVSLDLETGTIGCLIGPSGCGKSTLLRAIAGFEPVQHGEIWIDGRCVAAAGFSLPPEARRVGMVFQDFALFPHLSVADNLAFGIRRLPRSARRDRVATLLELVDLTQAANLYPHQLSGGMQQRVALARALAPCPDVLLLDEPFSSMDASLREQLAREVRDVLRREGVTAVLVTHDQLEAFAMADRIGVLSKGTLRQWDSALGLYQNPADRFVASFIGQGVILPGSALPPRQVMTELGKTSTLRAHGLMRDAAMEVLIRPDDLIDDPNAPCRATVIERSFRGGAYLYGLRLPSGNRVLALIPSQREYRLGETIGLRLVEREFPAFESQC